MYHSIAITTSNPPTAGICQIGLFLLFHLRHGRQPYRSCKKMVTEACQQLSTVITDHHDLDHDWHIEDDSEEMVASSLTWEHEVTDRTFMIHFLIPLNFSQLQILQVDLESQTHWQPDPETQSQTQPESYETLPEAVRDFRDMFHDSTKVRYIDCSIFIYFQIDDVVNPARKL